MMNVSEYASDVGKTVSEILKLCQGRLCVSALDQVGSVEISKYQMTKICYQMMT